MEPQVAVDGQVDPAVLASSYWRRTQMQRGFDTFSSTRPTARRRTAVAAAAAMAGTWRHRLAVAESFRAQIGSCSTQGGLASVEPCAAGRALRSSETAAAQVASADAVCAFGLLAHGWHSWRARAARWSAELNRQLGADYHVQQRAVSGAFFSWMVRATMILERSAREAVLVSLLRSGFLLKAWRRFAGAIEEEVRIRADLCLQRLAVADAFRRWTTQMVPCASAKRDVAALAVSSMADPFDDAPTAADVVSALRILPQCQCRARLARLRSCPLLTGLMAMAKPAAHHPERPLIHRRPRSPQESQRKTASWSDSQRSRRP